MSQDARDLALAALMGERVTLEDPPVLRSLGMIPDFDPPDTLLDASSAGSASSGPSAGSGASAAPPVAKETYPLRRYSAYGSLAPLNLQALRLPAVTALKLRPRPRLAIFLGANLSVPELTISGPPSALLLPYGSPYRSSAMKHALLLSGYGPPVPPAPPVFLGRSRLPTRGSRLPVRLGSPVRLPLPVRALPFNFQLQMMMHGNSLNQLLTGQLLRPAHRKGHRYKHLSVLMNFIAEPAPRAEINLPMTVPLPTFGEVWASLSPSQWFHSVWACWHVAMAAVVYLAAHHWHFPGLDTLAHLVFYDALAVLCVLVVLAMANFDCWTALLIRYPFGLGRIEVLVGFVLAVWLSFVGFDLVNHCIEEYVARFIMGKSEEHGLHGAEAAAHSHGVDHHHVPGATAVAAHPWIFQLVVWAAVATLMVTSYIVKSNTHRAVHRMLHPLATTAKLARVVASPAHAVMLALSLYLAVAFNPWFPHAWLPQDVVTFVVLVTMLAVGARQVYWLGMVLILLFPATQREFHRLYHTIEEGVERLDLFKQHAELRNLFITKFNHRLYVIGARVVMRGASDRDELALRQDVVLVVKRALLAYDTTLDQPAAGAADSEGWEDVPDPLHDKQVEVTIDVDRM